MKDKIIKALGLIAAATLIVSTVVYFVTHRLPAGLFPFSLAIFLGALVWKYRQTGPSTRILRGILLVICVINVFAGIMQIVL